MQKPMSPKKYILSKAKELPFHESFISEDWKEKGLASIFVSKIMPSGNFIIGVYLVDVFCLGLKNTLYQFNLTKTDYNEFYEKLDINENLIPCSLELAHNIIYGAIDYADELGFSPNGDFNITENILDDNFISDGIDEIEFGKDGKPFYIAGPDDNIKKIIATLNRSVGETNYLYVHPKDY